MAVTTAPKRATSYPPATDVIGGMASRKEVGGRWTKRSRTGGTLPADTRTVVLAELGD